jgi:hypothetical protein
MRILANKGFRKKEKGERVKEKGQRRKVGRRVQPARRVKVRKYSTCS